jgi:hypothetical protein
MQDITILLPTVPVWVIVVVVLIRAPRLQARLSIG